MMNGEFPRNGGGGGIKITARLKNSHSVPKWLHESL
jgi:hypothetical protein